VTACWRCRINIHGDIDFSVLLLELARAAGMKLEPENVKVSDGLQ